MFVLFKMDVAFIDYPSVLAAVNRTVALAMKEAETLQVRLPFVFSCSVQYTKEMHVDDCMISVLLVKH